MTKRTETKLARSTSTGINVKFYIYYYPYVFHFLKYIRLLRYKYDCSGFISQDFIVETNIKDQIELSYFHTLGTPNFISLHSHGMLQ